MKQRGELARAYLVVARFAQNFGNHIALQAAAHATASTRRSRRGQKRIKAERAVAKEIEDVPKMGRVAAHQQNGDDVHQVICSKRTLCSARSNFRVPIDENRALLIQLDRVTTAEHGGKHRVAVGAERTECGREELPADVETHLMRETWKNKEGG
jgi:hypothetical protein